MTISHFGRLFFSRQVNCKQCAYRVGVKHNLHFYYILQLAQGLALVVAISLMCCTTTRPTALPPTAKNSCRAIKLRHVPNPRASLDYVTHMHITLRPPLGHTV